MNRRTFIFGMASAPLLDLVPLASDPSPVAAAVNTFVPVERSWQLGEIVSIQVHKSTGTAVLISESGKILYSASKVLNIGKTQAMKENAPEKWHHPDTARVLEEFSQAVQDIKNGPDESNL